MRHSLQTGEKVGHFVWGGRLAAHLRSQIVVATLELHRQRSTWITLIPSLVDVPYNVIHPLSVRCRQTTISLNLRVLELKCIGLDLQRGTVSVMG